MPSPSRPVLANLIVPTAAFVVAAIAPFGPGAFLTLHAIASSAFENNGIGAVTFPTFGPRIADDIVIDAAALAVLAYGPRLVLAISTIQAARGQRVDPIGAIRRTLGRVIRTRGVSLMVGTFTFGIVAGLLVASSNSLASPVAADVCRTLAAVVATAGFGMAGLADRAAVTDVGGARDARAARLRSDARFAGPNYLDTTTARGGYDVATSADEATTVGMKSFLGPWAWAAAFVAMVADALPILVLYVAALANGGAEPRSTTLWISLLFVRATLEFGVAWMWSRVYVTRSVVRESVEAG